MSFAKLYKCVEICKCALEGIRPTNAMTKWPLSSSTQGFLSVILLGWVQLSFFQPALHETIKYRY